MTVNKNTDITANINNSNNLNAYSPVSVTNNINASQNFSVYNPVSITNKINKDITVNNSFTTNIGSGGGNHGGIGGSGNIGGGNTTTTNKANNPTYNNSNAINDNIDAALIAALTQIAGGN